jgi:ABC-type dipeptide/oligopeptide/nickel transport system permease subunit
VVRAQALATREAPFVEAARGLGASPVRIAVTHVLPATLVLFPAHVVLTLRFAVFAESTLAFVGLGDPSDASWGAMLGWAFANPLLFAGAAWTWLVLPPAVGIVVFLLLAGGLSSSCGPPTPRLRGLRCPPRPASADLQQSADTCLEHVRLCDRYAINQYRGLCR